MKKFFFYFTLILLIIFIFILLYKSIYNSNSYIPENNTDSKIQNISGKGLFLNNEINISELVIENKFTLINIWASWCAPCRSEHKYLMKLSNNSNINLIGLNYKDKKVNAKFFLKKFENPYSIILMDNDGTNSIELGAYGVPETYIISNKDKIIIKKYTGPLDQKKFNEIINLIKNEKF